MGPKYTGIFLTSWLDTERAHHAAERARILMAAESESAREDRTRIAPAESAPTQPAPAMVSVLVASQPIGIPTAPASLHGPPQVLARDPCRECLHWNQHYACPEYESNRYCCTPWRCWYAWHGLPCPLTSATGADAGTSAVPTTLNADASNAASSPTTAPSASH